MYSVIYHDLCNEFKMTIGKLPKKFREKSGLEYAAVVVRDSGLARLETPFIYPARRIDIISQHLDDLFS